MDLLGMLWKLQVCECDYGCLKKVVSAVGEKKTGRLDQSVQSGGRC